MPTILSIPRLRDTEEILNNSCESWRSCSLVPFCSDENKFYWVIPNPEEIAGLFEWGLGPVFHSNYRRSSAEAFLCATQEYTLIKFCSFDEKLFLFLAKRTAIWGSILASLECWIVMRFPQFKGKKPHWIIPCLEPDWEAKASRPSSANLTVEDFITRFSREKSYRRAATPLQITVKDFGLFSTDKANAHYYSGILIAEKWMGVDSAGRFPIRAPTMKKDMDFPCSKKLISEWCSQTQRDVKILPAGELEQDLFSLFSFAEIDEAAGECINEFGQEDSTENFLYRFMAAKLLTKLPTYDARVLPNISEEIAFFLMGRGLEKISRTADNLHEIVTRYKNIPKSLMFPAHVWWERLRAFLRKLFQKLVSFATELTANPHGIPAEAIFLLDSPESLVLDPLDLPVLDNPQSATVDNELGCSDDSEVTWLLYKAKNLKFALIPKTCDINKAPEVVRLLEHMVSLSRNDPGWLELSESVKEAGRGRNVNTWEAAWKTFRTRIDSMDNGGSSPYIKIFEFAAKKPYHKKIVKNVCRILENYSPENLRLSLSMFTHTFGVRRVSFLNGEPAKIPTWPHSETPAVIAHERLTASFDDVFKQGKIRAGGLCAISECTSETEDQIACGFHTHACTDVVARSHFSALSPSFLSDDRVEAALERWRRWPGWANAPVKYRLRFLWEAVGMMAVEDNSQVEFEPTTPASLTKAMMLRIGTGTGVEWTDNQIFANTYVLAGLDFFVKNWEITVRARNWHEVYESSHGGALFTVVTSFQADERQYGPMIFAAKNIRGKIITEDLVGRSTDDRLVRQLRETREEASAKLIERQHVKMEDGLCPEIASLAAFQRTRNDNVRLVFVAQNEEVFEAVRKAIVAAEALIDDGEPRTGLSVVMSENFCQGSPVVLKWANKHEVWSSLRPLPFNKKINRGLLPSVVFEKPVWKFLVDCVFGHKKRGFCPENIIGALTLEFKPDANDTRLRRQKQAFSLTLAFEEWGKLGVLNKFQIFGYDLKFTEDIPAGARAVEPDDVTPFFEGKRGIDIQVAYATKVQSKAPYFPMLKHQHLPIYSAKAFTRPVNEIANGRPQRLFEQLRATKIGPDFDGLEAADVIALFEARLANTNELQMEAARGLGIDTFVDENGVERLVPEPPPVRDEEGVELTEEEKYFSYLPKRFHHQAQEWEVILENAAKRGLHPDLKELLTTFEDFDKIHESLHPRFRGWIDYFRGLKTLTGTAEPFGVPTRQVLLEFQDRVHWHTQVQELAQGLKKLSFKSKRAKKEKGEKRNPCIDSRLGTGLPPPPKGIWRWSSFVYVPFVEGGKVRNRALLPKDVPKNKLVTIEPIEWADDLNEAYHERYKNMHAMGVKSKKQLVKKGNIDDLSEGEGKQIKALYSSLVAFFPDEGLAETPFVIERVKDLANLVVAKPGPVLQLVSDLADASGNAESVKRNKEKLRKSIFEGLKWTNQMGKVTIWINDFYPEKGDKW